jgi:hypothetical protein
LAYTPIFTYNGGANPPIDWPRLMVADTQEFDPDGITPGYVFSDQEIMAMTQIVMMQFQSAQFYSPPAGLNLPVTPVPWLRIAAGLLDCMVANKAKLASIKKILDVQLDSSDAAKFLAAQAKAYRDADDNAGAFMVIEQVNNDWSLYRRYWNQVQRQQGIGFAG